MHIGYATFLQYPTNNTGVVSDTAALSYGCHILGNSVSAQPRPIYTVRLGMRWPLSCLPAVVVKHQPVLNLSLTRPEESIIPGAAPRPGSDCPETLSARRPRPERSVTSRVGSGRRRRTRPEWRGRTFRSDLREERRTGQLTGCVVVRV